MLDHFVNKKITLICPYNFIIDPKKNIEEEEERISRSLRKIKKTKKQTKKLKYNM
jgi:hypothetical protein